MGEKGGELGGAGHQKAYKALKTFIFRFLLRRKRKITFVLLTFKEKTLIYTFVL